jgi:hypothetical protein
MDWFHLPPPPADVPPPQDEDDYQLRMQAVEEMVLPSMRDLGYRMERRADALRARRPPIELPDWGAGMLKLDLEVGPRPTETIDRQIPYDIAGALEENAPQAMLRDLYRTEDEYNIQYAPPWEGEMWRPVNASELVRAAMTSTSRVGPSYTPLGQQLQDVGADLRAIIRSSWADQSIRKDDWTPPVRRKTRGPSR